MHLRNKQHTVCLSANSYRSPGTALVGLGQGWGKESGQLEESHHVSHGERQLRSLRQAVHRVPANHLLCNWSLSSVSSADTGCFLS